MKVAIIKTEKITYLNLPNNVYGNFWISENDENGIEQNLINIEGRNGKWVLVSNSDIFLQRSNSLVIEEELKTFTLYPIYNKKKSELFYLYCLPYMDDNVLVYEITDYKAKRQ